MDTHGEPSDEHVTNAELRQASAHLQSSFEGVGRHRMLEGIEPVICSRVWVLSTSLLVRTTDVSTSSSSASAGSRRSPNTPCR